MKKRHSAEPIVAKLRQADIELGKRPEGVRVCVRLGIRPFSRLAVVPSVGPAESSVFRIIAMARGREIT